MEIVVSVNVSPIYISFIDCYFVSLAILIALPFVLVVHERL